MELWLFFTIFGVVLFVPSTIVLLILKRLKETILIVIKKNGTIKKVVINDKILSSGQITVIGKKKIKPIPIRQNEVRYGGFRRWIIKDLENVPQEDNSVTNEEVEAYLNSETINMLLLFGKLKDLLIALLVGGIVVTIIGVVIVGYLTVTKETGLTATNETLQVIELGCKNAILNLGVTGEV